MDKRVVGVLVGVGLVVVALWWRGTGTPPISEEPTASDPASPVPSTPHRAEPSTASEAEEVEAPPEVETFEAQNAVDEALHALADVFGEGHVRCEAGSLRDGSLRGGFTRGEVAGGWITAIVSRVDGDTRMWSGASDEPVGVLTWSGAWPASVGSCELHEVESVTLTGRALGEDGAGVAGALLRGCDGRLLNAGDDGGFTTEGWREVSCRLSAKVREGAGFGPEVVITPTSSEGMSGIEVPVSEQPESQQSAWDLYDAMMDAEIAGVEGEDPYEMALDTPGLTGEARDQLRAWVDERRRGRELGNDVRSELDYRQEGYVPDDMLKMSPDPLR